MRLPVPASKSTTKSTRAYRIASDSQVAEDGLHGVYRPTVLLRRSSSSFNRHHQENKQEESSAISEMFLKTHHHHHHQEAEITKEEEGQQDDQAASSSTSSSSSSSCSCSSCSACNNAADKASISNKATKASSSSAIDNDGGAGENNCFRGATVWVANNFNSMSSRSKGSYTLENDDDGDEAEKQQQTKPEQGMNEDFEITEPPQDEEQKISQNNQQEDSSNEDQPKSSEEIVEEMTTTTTTVIKETTISVQSIVTIDHVPTAPRDTISVKSAPLLSDNAIKKTLMMNKTDDDSTMSDYTRIVQMQQRDRSATTDQVGPSFSITARNNESPRQKLLTNTAAPSTPPPVNLNKISSEALDDLKQMEVQSCNIDDPSSTKRQRCDPEYAFLSPSVPVSRTVTPDNMLEEDLLHGGASSGVWRIVVAIDFGTTYSGYAFAFTNHPSRIYVMRRWQQGDPGLRDSKIPTALLLKPNGKFHSFGFEARNKYHSLDHDQAKHWLYFQNFKTILYAGDGNKQLNENTQVEAVNGSQVPALVVFAYVLRFFRQHAIAEIQLMTDQTPSIPPVTLDSIRWVVTVPAIWSQPAKQFMRQAAYMADLASEVRPEQLIIALEPEAASVFIRSLRLVDLPPQFPGSGIVERVRPNSPSNSLASSYYYFSQNCTADIPIELLLHNRRKRTRNPPAATASSLADDEDNQLASFDDPNGEEVICPRETIGHSLGIGSRYIVVDCGGGTVDITVHELVSGGIKELYKASGSNHGSLAVNNAFLDLLSILFKEDFLSSFRQRRPAGYLDLLAAFESRKRAASPWKMTSLNVALPFNFLDLYQRTYHETVDHVLSRLLLDPPAENREEDRTSYEPVKQGDVSWSACGGVLRLYPPVVRRLFEPALKAVIHDVEHVLDEASSCGVDRLFIVGGFAESPILQHELRQHFGERYSIIIPPEPSLAVLRGAVAFGLDPGVVQVRRSQLTYGIGVLHRYNPAKHPRYKRILRFGTYWCPDVFDKFVVANQAVSDGDIVVRRYSPVSPQQSTAIVKLYACPNANVNYLTDTGVYPCGILRLNLAPLDVTPCSNKPRNAKREIQIRMSFADTEIRCLAVDIATQEAVSVTLDFLARPDDQVPSNNDGANEAEPQNYLPDEEDSKQDEIKKIKNGLQQSM